MLVEGFALVLGAMIARRKIPLLVGSSTMLLGTLIKATQWIIHRELTMPLVGILMGFFVLAVASLFESRMNRLVGQAVDKAKSEARHFWMSWD